MGRLAFQLFTLCPAVLLMLTALAGCSEPAPKNAAEAEVIAAAIDTAIQRKQKRVPTASFYDDDLAHLRDKIRAGRPEAMCDGVLFYTFERPELEGEGAREFMVSVFSVGFKPVAVKLLRGDAVVAKAAVPRVREGRVSEHAVWQEIFIYFVTTHPDPSSDFLDYPKFELDAPEGSYDLVFVDEAGRALRPVTITLRASEHGRVR